MNPALQTFFVAAACGLLAFGVTAYITALILRLRERSEGQAVARVMYEMESMTPREKDRYLRRPLHGLPRCACGMYSVPGRNRQILTDEVTHALALCQPNREIIPHEG